MDVPLSAPGASVAAATSWWWLCWQCSRLKQLSLPPLSSATYFIAHRRTGRRGLDLIVPTPKHGVPRGSQFALARRCSRRRPRRRPRCFPPTTQAIRPSTPTPNIRPSMRPARPFCLLIRVSRHNIPTNIPFLLSSRPRPLHRQQLACIQWRVLYRSLSRSLPSITRSVCGYIAPALSSRWASSTAVPISSRTTLPPMLSSMMVLTFQVSPRPRLRPLQTPESRQKTHLPPLKRNG